MKLHLKIDNYGLSHKLLTSSGEEIEGVVEIILPTINKKGDFPEVLVKFHMDSGVIHLHPAEADL